MRWFRKKETQSEKPKPITITLANLEDYLIQCDNPPMVEGEPHPKSIEPTLHGFYWWMWVQYGPVTDDDTKNKRRSMDQRQKLAAAGLVITLLAVTILPAAATGSVILWAIAGIMLFVVWVNFLCSVIFKNKGNP